jgi:hypothetical protein
VGPELEAAFPYGRRSRGCGRCGRSQSLVSVIEIGRHNSSLSLSFVAIIRRPEWGQSSRQDYGYRGRGRGHCGGSLLLMSVIRVSCGSWLLQLIISLAVVVYLGCSGWRCFCQERKRASAEADTRVLVSSKREGRHRYRGKHSTSLR